MNMGTDGSQGRLITICASEALEVGGLGVRFNVIGEKGTCPAFVVRHSKGLAAYINRCAHQDLELDWNLGHFFSNNRNELICATHGALYSAENGKCVGGPCDGFGLESLQVVEKEGTVYLSDRRYFGIRPKENTGG